MQGRDVAIGVGVGALLLLLVGLLGSSMMIGHGMMGWGGIGFTPLWGILMMLFWALAIGGIVLLLLSLLRQGQPAGAGPEAESAQPMDILRHRYARGEITREQFEQMRRDLEQG